MTYKGLTVFTILAGLATTSSAQGMGDDVTLRVLVKSDVAVEYEAGRLQKADLSIEPEFGADLGWAGRLQFRARARVDFADELEPGVPVLSDMLGSPLTRRQFVGELAELELRELFVDKYVGPVFLRIGKQQIVWGQADGLRVLDIVNPFSFREFLLPSFDDRRIPLWTAQAEVQIGGAALQLLWIPDHSYDDIPEAKARFAFSSPRLVPEAPTGRPRDVRLAAPVRPDTLIRDDDYGFRFSTFSGGWDLSANYLYHFHDTPVLRSALDLSGNVDITWDYERTHTVGASAANAFGSVTFRSELAYSSRRFFQTTDATDEDGVFAVDELAYVVGLDYQHSADLLVSGQVFQSILADTPEGAARDQVDTTATLRVDRQWQHDTLAATVQLIHSLSDGDGLLQLELRWRALSNLQVSVGSDQFFGDQSGVFGQFDSADRVTVGFEYGF